MDTSNRVIETAYNINLLKSSKSKHKLLTWRLRFVQISAHTIIGDTGDGHIMQFSQNHWKSIMTKHSITLNCNLTNTRLQQVRQLL